MIVETAATLFLLYMLNITTKVRYPSPESCNNEIALYFFFVAVARTSSSEDDAMMLVIINVIIAAVFLTVTLILMIVIFSSWWRIKTLKNELKMEED